MIRSLLFRLLQNQTCWRLIDGVLGRLSEWRRRLIRLRSRDGRPIISPSNMPAAPVAHFDDLVVRRGPFEGLRYPAARSSGSRLFPKLIGCYERELHPVFEAMIRAGN